METPNSSAVPSSKPSRTGQHFESFRDGPHTCLAVAAARVVAEIPGVHSPLFIHGHRESGKTHLLRAIHCKMAECPAHGSLVVHLFQCGRSADVRRLAGADVLMLDDFDLLAEAQRGPMLELVASMVKAGKQVVIGSLVPPEEIPWFASSQADLFRMGIIAKLGCPDFETRVALLKGEAHKWGVELPTDVAEFAAARIGRSGALDAIRVFGTLNAGGVLIDMALARERLADFGDAGTSKVFRPRPTG